MYELHRVCFIVEEVTEGLEDVLSEMFYELTDKYGFGLQTLIPDIEANQPVFDIFNQPYKKLHVCNLVGQIGKKSQIRGKPNLRSCFINLKVQADAVEMIGNYKSKDKQFFRVGRTTTVKNHSEMACYMIEECHTFVALWSNGKFVQSLAQYANSLDKKVVIADI